MIHLLGYSFLPKYQNTEHSHWIVYHQTYQCSLRNGLGPLDSRQGCGLSCTILSLIRKTSHRIGRHSAVQLRAWTNDMSVFRCKSKFISVPEQKFRSCSNILWYQLHQWNCLWWSYFHNWCFPTLADRDILLIKLYVHLVTQK